MRGLGDLVEKTLTVTGIKPAFEKLRGGPCPGCKKRRDKLNKLVPFGKTGE